jgi:hypothetical protein
MTEHYEEQLSVGQFAPMRILALMEQVFDIDPKYQNAALELQAALIIADEKVPGEKDKKFWDRVRPLQEVKADILAAGVAEDDYNKRVDAVKSKLGTEGYAVPQGVPPSAEILSNDNAGLVKDESGNNKPVISQDQKNVALLFQAAARLAVNDISNLAEPRIFDNDPEALKTAQTAVAAKIAAQKAGTYTEEMRQADQKAAEQAMQAFDELYEQSMTSQSLVTGLTEKAEGIINQLSR